MSAFSRFEPRLQDAIASRLGWTSLRPVQEEASNAILDGENAVVLAPTAGGKTEASMFPTLSMLMAREPDGVGAIYIAPIKALLNNQADRLGTYTEMVGLDRFVWHGDTAAGDKRKFVRDPTALLMTTPESLEVMLISSKVDAKRLFADLRIVVIDEVHALAGTDRGAHLMSVLERLRRLSQHDVQRVGLSATVGNPKDILRWVQGTSQRAGRVVDPPKPKSKRELLIIHSQEPRDLAFDAAAMARGKKSLFFCQSRAMTETVAERMRGAGTEVFVHHSAVSKEERLDAEKRFHHGRDACIVCTSTLELGIDVGDLDRVLQSEAPDTVSSFLQRMGRTGRRAGQAANTTFFCQSADSTLQAIALIELAKAGWVENVAVQDRCWPAFVHQLFAMSLAGSGVPTEEAWQHLSSVPDFAGITRDEYDRLIEHMLADEALFAASGRLVLGAKAERIYGKKNFMELYAVFSSPQSYSVLSTDGRSIGTLSQDFVDGLVPGASSFLLGGRAWSVELVLHKDREIKVTPAPRGKQPSWGGFTPQFLGFELCQKIREILASDTEYAYLHESAQLALEEKRQAFLDVLEPEGLSFEDRADETIWWTFAGGRINGTLKYALEALGDWKVVPDNFSVKIRGISPGGRELHDAVTTLSHDSFWADDLWDRIRGKLPAYRLTKFEPVLPEWVSREVVATYLLDVESTSSFVKQRGNDAYGR